ncbi:MAG TPA: DUF4019 domain-containing protein [Polyangiaceae bacterium]|jgi:hypothetical protein
MKLAMPRRLLLALSILAVAGGCAHEEAAGTSAANGPTGATPAATATATATANATTAANATATAAPPTSTAAANDPPGSNEKAAQAAAEAWLALVDAGSYGASWTEAASLFKKTIDQPGWEKALTGVRAPLGKVVSRKLASATYRTSLPGGPDGHYVVVVYTTSFENKQAATETVTPMKDADGRWHVAGYFIH